MRAKPRILKVSPEILSTVEDSQLGSPPESGLLLLLICLLVFSGETEVQRREVTSPSHGVLGHG